MRLMHFFSGMRNTLSRIFKSLTVLWIDSSEHENELINDVLDSPYDDLEREQEEIALTQEALEADCDKYIASCADKAREIFSDKLPETIQEIYLQKIHSEITAEFDASIKHLLQEIVESTELYLLEAKELEEEQDMATDLESVIISVYEKKLDALQEKISSAFSQKAQACLEDNANLVNMPVAEEEATVENFTPAVFFRARAIRKIPMPYDISRHNILPEGVKRFSKPVWRFGFDR